MSGIYGTIKPANINIEQDVAIYYNYKPNRGYETVSAFNELSTTNLIKAQLSGTTLTTIDGLYNLKLPLSEFGEKGIYTVYIKPKELTVNIHAIGELAEYSDVRGVIFNADSFDESLRGENQLVGYRIEYSGGYTRIITSSNLCNTVTVGGQNRFRLYSNSGNSGSSNGRLIFCTVTPSGANGFNPTAPPPIGEGGETVRVVNTKFNPIMFEIEMVDHDIETLSNILEGPQVRNLENGTFTIYNKNNEIYKQFETYTIKTQLGKPLYDVKDNKSIIDSTQSYDIIIGRD